MAKAPANKATNRGSSTTGKVKAAASKVAKAVGAVSSAPKPAPRPRVKMAPGSTASTPEVVMKLNHNEIAQKAYEIWMAKGCPQGRDEENWREAEAVLASRR